MKRSDEQQRCDDVTKMRRLSSWLFFYLISHSHSLDGYRAVLFRSIDEGVYISIDGCRSVRSIVVLVLVRLRKQERSICIRRQGRRRTGGRGCLALILDCRLHFDRCQPHKDKAVAPKPKRDNQNSKTVHIRTFAVALILYLCRRQRGIP